MHNDWKLKLGKAGIMPSYGFVFIATLGLSFVQVFSTLLKTSGMSSLEQVILRIFIALAAMLLFLVSTKNLTMPNASHVPFFLAIGTVWGMFIFSSISAIALGAPIAVVAALMYTQPVYTAIVSFATGKEKASARKIFFVLVAVGGTLLVSGFYLPQFTEMKIGIAFAALSGLLYSAYLQLKRWPEAKAYRPSSALAYTLAFSVPIVIFMGAILGAFAPDKALVSLTFPTAYQVLLLVLFALFSTLLPYGALNYVKNADIGPTSEAVLLVFGAMLKVGWSVLLFNQILARLQYVGAGMIIMTILFLGGGT